MIRFPQRMLVVIFLLLSGARLAHGVTPTAVPTATPTATPTAVPTAVPTSTPTAAPSAVPSAPPTFTRPSESLTVVVASAIALDAALDNTTQLEQDLFFVVKEAVGNKARSVEVTSFNVGSRRRLLTGTTVIGFDTTIATRFSYRSFGLEDAAATTEAEAVLAEFAVDMSRAVDEDWFGLSASTLTFRFVSINTARSLAYLNNATFNYTRDAEFVDADEEDDDYDSSFRGLYEDFMFIILPVLFIFACMCTTCGCFTCSQIKCGKSCKSMKNACAFLGARCYALLAGEREARHFDFQETKWVFSEEEAEGASAL